jgi:acetyl-CoA C-acetyltransferase
MNMGRVVAVQLGMDFLPGTTITRYCSSSLQTTRMAFHAIKAGEGDAYISAGVETVSRFIKGNSDMIPARSSPTRPSPTPSSARRRSPRAGVDGWTDPRESGDLPDVYIAMGQTAENVALLKDVSREEMDEFAARSQQLFEKAAADGFWDRDVVPITTPDGTTVTKDDSPRAGTTVEGLGGLKPVFRPTAGSRPATPARSTTAPPPSSS